MNAAIAIILTLFISSSSFAAIPDLYLPPTGVVYTDPGDIYSLMSKNYEGLEYKECATEKMFGTRDYALMAIAGIKIKSLEFLLRQETFKGRTYAYISALLMFDTGLKSQSTFGCRLK